MSKKNNRRGHDGGHSGAGSNRGWGRFDNSGDDTLVATGGNAKLYGGNGDDVLIGAGGNDRLYGGRGDDSISGGDGRNRVDAGDGNDTVSTGQHDDRIDAGRGDDVVASGDGRDRVDGGSGNDTIDAGGDRDTVYGGSGDDSIIGGGGDDCLSGGSGDDTIDGGEGHDRIDGGSGNDLIDGGAGRDRVYGGDGDDTIDGGAGDDTLSGGRGDDLIDGGDGDDRLYAGRGDDTLIGGAGNDLIHGDRDDDVIRGDGDGFGNVPGPTQLQRGANGTYDVQGLDAVVLSVDFLGGSAGFDNSFGYYLADANGSPIGGEIIFRNVKCSDDDAGDDVRTISLTADDLNGAASLGFFLLPDGGDRNWRLRDGDDVSFRQDSQGDWQAVSHGRVLNSAYGRDTVYFSDSSLNKDGLDHEVDNSLSGNSAWEDLLGGGDNDFNDATFRITVLDGPQPAFNDRIFADRGDDLVNGDLGNDFIDGGRGDDTLQGGTGDDTINADRDDDLVIHNVADNQGFHDTYDGGKGQDTLELEVTEAELAVLADDIAAFQDVLAEGGPSHGHWYHHWHHHGNNDRAFDFEAIGLSVRNFEALNLTIVNFNPDAADDAVVTDEDTALLIDVLANDSDADGDPLTITGVTQPANGTVEIVGNRILFTPNDNYNGPESFTYTVFDGVDGFDTATVSLTINPVNDAPVAVDDTITVVEDTTTTIDVLANDIDIDGDTLTIVTASALNGTVTINADSTLGYTPNGNYYGTDTISYTISDGALSSSATVSVTVTNDGTDALFTDGNDTVDFNTVTPFDHDDGNTSDALDGDDLIILPTDQAAADASGFDTGAPFNAGSGDDTVIGGDVGDTINAGDGEDSVSGGTGDDLILGGEGNDMLSGDGGDDTLLGGAGDDAFFGGTGDDSINGGAGNDNVTFTGNADEYDVTFNDDGTVTIVDTVPGRDGTTTLEDVETATFADDTFFTDGTNNAPEAFDETATTDEDTAVSIDVLANDTDFDSDPLTVASANAANGSVTIGTDGTITYTGDADFNGTDTITYTVDDGRGGTDIGEVSVTVNAVNDAPVITVPTGGALRFDGNAANHVQVAHDADLSGSSWTVEAWVTTTDADSQFNRVVTKPVGGGQTYSLVVRNGEAHIRFDDASIGQQFVQAGFVADGQPHHIAGVFDDAGNTLSLYVDGQLTGSIATSATPRQGTEELNIGRFNDGFGQGFRGDVSEVRVWSAPRSATEIAASFDQVLDSANEPDLALYMTFDPTFAEPGKVQDLSGHDFDGTIFGSLQTVPGAAPVDQAIQTEVGQEVRFFGAAVADADAADGANQIQVTVESVNGTIDVSSGTGASITGDQSKSITITGTPAQVSASLSNMTFTPDAGFVGTETVTITADDLGNSGAGGALTDVQTFTILVVEPNVAPEAADDVATVDEDGTILIDALANDADDNGDALTITAITVPANGSAVIEGNQIRYTPDADFNGTDTISYTVTDGKGEFDTALVTVTVNAVNDAPVADDDTATTDEDTAVSIDVLGNDSDIDGDALTVTAASAANGSVVIESDGSLTYTPDADFSGTDTISYTTSDGDLTDTAEVSVTVNAVADAPIIEASTRVTASDEILVNTTQAGDQDHPAVAALADGGYVVVWDQGAGSVTESGRDVLFQRFDAGGQPVGSETEVTTSDGTNWLVTVEGRQDGGFIVAWTAEQASDILVQIFDANGVPNGAQFVANSTTANEQRVPAVQELPNGSFIVAWRNKINLNDTEVRLQKFAADGTPVGGEILVNETGDRAGSPDMTVLQNGNLLISYVVVDAGDADVAAKILDQDGNVVVGEFRLHPPSTGVQVKNAVSALADGGFVATWASDDGDDFGIFMQRFDSGGNTIGSESLINDVIVGEQNSPNVVSLPNGDILVTWTHADTASGGDVSGRLVDPDGTPLSEEFLLNTTIAGEQSSDTGDFVADKLAVLNDGRVVSVWQSSTNDSEPDSIIARVFSLSGSELDTVALEDQAIRLPLNVELSDTDGSETLDDIVISGVPTDASLSAGIDLGNGDWRLVKADLAELDLIPAANFNGEISLVVTATSRETGNGSLATSSESFTITVDAVNDAPVAANDTATTDEDVAVNVNVLGNDSDIDGDALTVTAASAANGSVVIESDGSLTYTPDADFNGTDAISYTLSDGELTDTAEVAVTVNPVNDAPEIDAGGSELSSDLTVGFTRAQTLDASDLLANYVNPFRSAVVVDEGALDVLHVSARPGSGFDRTVLVEIPLFSVGELDADARVTINIDGLIQRVGGDQDILFGVRDTDQHLSFFSSDGGTGLLLADALTGNGPFGIASPENPPLTDRTVPSGSQVEDFTLRIDLDGDTDRITLVEGNGASINVAGDPGLYIDAQDAVSIIIGSDQFHEVYEIVSLAFSAEVDGLIDSGSITFTDVDLGDTHSAAVTSVSTTGDTNGIATATLAGFLTLGAVTASSAGSTGSVDWSFAADDDLFAYLGAGESLELAYTVTVDDNAGGTDSETVTVTINGRNDGPVAVDDVASTDEDTATSIAVLANDSDVDGDALTVTSAIANNGQVVIETDGSLTYTPDADFNGADTISYVISDGELTNTAQVAVTVDPVNDAPVAADNAAATDEDTPVTIDVLGNDTDIDGDALTVTAASAANGTVVVEADGSLTYTPDADFNGTDTISYTIEDGLGGDDTGTVSVTVNAVNDAPVVTDDVATTDEDVAFSIDVLGNDSDPDGDGLTVVAASAANGSVAIESDGSLTYLGNQDFNGTDTISYTVEDGNGGADTAEVSVTVNAVNDAPVLHFASAELGSIDVADMIAGDGGFVMFNDSIYTNAGFAVDGAGDVNGDGLSDLLVTERRGSPDGVASGGTGYVVFGKTDGGQIDLADIAAGNGGFAVNGSDPGGFLGQEVSAAGDVNGDGLADFIIGSYNIDGAAPNSGAAFVVFGKADGAPLNTDQLDNGIGGFAIRNSEIQSGRVGSSVSSIGDVNGDGLDDLLVGAASANYSAGVGYVVFGKADGTTVDLSDIDAETGNLGFAMKGTAFVTTIREVGFSIDNAGDVNGDGLDDIIVGAPQSNTDGAQGTEGGAIVVFGKTDSATVELVDILAGSGGGFAIHSQERHARLGFEVAGAGDINGDGLADMLLSDPQARYGSAFVSEAYVVFGKTDTAEVLVENLEADSAGFVVRDLAANSRRAEVSGAGDLNGDGLDDLMIGQTLVVNDNDVAVVFGKTDNAPVTMDDIRNEDGGFVITANTLPFEGLGYSLAQAGDVNGDGFGDLILGATAASIGAASTYGGGAIVIFAEPTIRTDFALFPTVQLTEDSSVEITTIGVTDVDVDEGTGQIEVVLSAANGSIDVTDTGATILDDGTATVTVTGTLAEVNGAIGSLIYTPDANFNGPDSLQITVNDLGNTGSGGPLTDVEAVQINVSAVADAPVATDDTAVTDEDTAVSINVLGNDSDADGDPLTVTAASADIGSVVIETDGSLTYTPDADFNGVDTITYTISDGDLTDTAQVTVTVDPVADRQTVSGPVDAGSVDDADAPVTIDLLANAFDADGDDLDVQGVTVTSSNAGRAVAFTVDQETGELVVDPFQFGDLLDGQNETVTIDYAVSDDSADFTDSIGSPNVPNGGVTYVIDFDDNSTSTFVRSSGPFLPVAQEPLNGAYLHLNPNNGFGGSVTVRTFLDGVETTRDASEFTFENYGGTVNGGGFSGAFSNSTIDWTVHDLETADGERCVSIRLEGISHFTDDGLTVASASFLVTTDVAAQATLEVTGVTRVLFTDGDDTVDLTDVAGVVDDGNVSDAGDGHDIVTLPDNATEAAKVGFAVGQTFFGGAGEDNITGGGLDDVIDGGGDDDIILSGAGDDSIIGGSGRDTLRGDDGNDSLSGDAKADDLFGGNGNDTLLGGDGFDELFGEAGNDLLHGGTADISDGDDTLIGGNGDDTLIGGNGDDVFIFSTGDGADQVSDFTAGAGTDDVLDFSGDASITSTADLTFGDDGAGNATVGYGASDLITLIGVVPGTLDSDDFQF